MARRLTVLSALAVSAALVLAGCAEDTSGGSGGGAGGTEDSSGPIRIGVVLDITGAGASLGVPERKTLEMLADRTNSEGGIDGREVELLIEDNQSTEDGAARAANKLIQSDRVDLLIGASRTGPSLAMRPIAEQAQIPMISLAANAKVVEGSEWVFKTAQNDRVVIERIVDDAVAQGYRRIAIARDASGYGEGVAEMFEEVGGPKGLEIVAVEKFAPDASDFTAQMVNIRNAEPDAVVIWGIPPAAALAQKAYEQLALAAPLYQSHGIGNQVFLDTAGESADGLIAPLGRLVVAEQLPEDDPQKKVITDLVTAYQETYSGETPSTFAGHAYDAFEMARMVLDEVGTDKQAVRDALEQVSDWPGISGVFTMSPDDHSGLTKDALVMVTVEGGRWRLAGDH
jgi:branched-chain amino acid transport system substrate-binding protein